MLPCKTCQNLISRREAKENDGYCGNCIQSRSENQKVSNDLLTSFGGKGVRGFVQWLNMGNFLRPIRFNAGDVDRYNDRLAVIEAMVGQAKFDRLVNEFAKVVLIITKEETEANG